MLMQNFGLTNKEHYGMLWYFLEWSMAMFHWMESHFHDWIDYNGAAFSVKLLEQTTTQTELRLSSRIIQLLLFPPLSEKI